MKALLAPLFLCLLSGLGYSQSMHLDSTFNGTGTAVFNYFGGSLTTHDAVILPDGDILISGESTAGLFVLRLHDNGIVDSSFGWNGYAFGPSNNSSTFCGRKIVVQSDGRIISNGKYFSPDVYSYLAFYRFNTDGTADLSFGPEGRITLDPGYKSSLRDLALDGNGKILFVGTYYMDGVSGSNSVIGRLNTDGTIDETFGTDGYIFIESIMEDDGAHAFYVQPDGKILFGGKTMEDPLGDNDLKIFRFNGDGSVDSTFDEDGVKTIDYFFGHENLNFMYLLDDGKVYILTGECGTTYALVLHKLNPDGSFDESFSDDGTLVYYFGAISNSYLSVAPYLDGKIIFGGGYGDFEALRLFGDGSLDTSFFTTGETAVDLYGFDDNDLGFIALPYENGKMLVVGTSVPDVNGQFSAMRLTPDDPIEVDTTGSDTTTTAITLLSSELPDITIAPNPPQNTLSFHADENISCIEILNLAGEIVLNKSWPISVLSGSINVEGLAKGMYILKIYNQEKIMCKKFMIAR